MKKNSYSLLKIVRSRQGNKIVTLLSRRDLPINKSITKHWSLNEIVDVKTNLMRYARYAGQILIRNSYLTPEMLKFEERRPDGLFIRVHMPTVYYVLLF